MSKVGLLTAQCSLLIAQKFSVTMSALGRIRRRESPLELRVCPLATGEVTTSGSENIPQLPNHKVKIKKQGQFTKVTPTSVGSSVHLEWGLSLRFCGLKSAFRSAS